MQDWHEAIDLYREDSADACAVRRRSVHFWASVFPPSAGSLGRPCCLPLTRRLRAAKGPHVRN